MKIIFEDKSYLEIKKSETTENIVLIIQAKDVENPLKKITNSVEITKTQFEQLFTSVK